MKKSLSPILILTGLVLSQVLLNGCTSSKATRFYSLNPLKSASPSAMAYGGSPSTSNPRPSLGIASVEIPDYLDRPQIVTRDAGSGLKIAEFDQWAGDLDKDVTRVLAETLSDQFPNTPVYILTGRRALPADYRITVHLTRLDPIPGKGVWLEGLWTVLAENGRRIEVRGESSVTEPIQGTGYGAIVAAMSRAVDQLGKEIASNLKPLIAAAGNGTKTASSGR
jgi:uncharacterized protein